MSEKSWINPFVVWVGVNAPLYSVVPGPRAIEGLHAPEGQGVMPMVRDISSTMPPTRCVGMTLGIDTKM